MVKYGPNLYLLKLNRPPSIQPDGFKPAKSNQLVKSKLKHLLHCQERNTGLMSKNSFHSMHAQIRYGLPLKWPWPLRSYGF